MQTPDFSTTVLVNQTPAHVFHAITHVRRWWSEEIEGGTANLNDVFFYHYKDIHRCTVKLIEVIPDQRVVWLILDNHFSFIEDQSEWKNTRLVFEITSVGSQTQLQFTHVGLVLEYECYNVCKDGWSNYINNSLRNLIVTGQGQPNPKEGDGFNAQLAKKWNLQD